MRILVTGGTGLIGRRLCAALVARGDAVTVLSRRPGSVREQCGPGVAPIGSLAEWRAEVGFDAIVNLAGAPIVDRPWSARRKQELVASRVGFTEQLVDRIAAAATPPRVLISGSAIGYYGDRGDEVVDETAAPGSDFAAHLCRDWERAAARAADLGVRVCLLRTGLVLDREGGLLAKLLPPFRLGLGARLGEGRQWMSWIDIADHVGATLHLLDGDGAGPYNLTAPQAVTNAEFTRELARTLHRPAALAAPSCALRLVLGERAPMLLGGQRVAPARLAAAGFSFAWPQLQTSLERQLR